MDNSKISSSFTIVSSEVDGSKCKRTKFLLRDRPPTQPHSTILHVFLLTKDISSRDIRLLSIIMKLDGISLVMLRAPKYHLKDSTTMSLPRNHDP